MQGIAGCVVSMRKRRTKVVFFWEMKGGIRSEVEMLVCRW
jgi:hypothetical protein